MEEGGVLEKVGGGEEGCRGTLEIHTGQWVWSNR